MKSPSQVDLANVLLESRVYPHPAAEIKRLETHMSWIFLTGTYAYKIKKPIHFEFADFSTLSLREHYCREELRLNRLFAPELYLGVVPIIQSADGIIRIETEIPQRANHIENPARVKGEIVEWAVRMVQFDTNLQADILVERGLASTSQFRTFGRLLAAQHRNLVQPKVSPDLETAVIKNFLTLESLDCCNGWSSRLNALRIKTEQELKVNSSLIQSRSNGGFIRDCHGDLHLSNMVAINGELRAFDCLEFNDQLRAIDVWNDIAFLLMDCALRGRSDLAYACVDGYLESGGDYAGIQLLPLYARYRSMVRAKVAALSLDQQSAHCASKKTSSDSGNAAQRKLEDHISWTEQQYKRGPGRLIITCGLSGSGKSYWAKQLVPELNALRLRTDVYRKQRACLLPNEKSASTLGGGLYTAKRSEEIYTALADFCESLLRVGETVIVDAACLLADQRKVLLAAGHKADAETLVLHLRASEAELRRRIVARGIAAKDVSEADESVLDWQLANQQLPTAGAFVLSVDTEHLQLFELTKAIETKFMRRLW